LLDIPFFQRAYVWEESQWERLIEDLETVTRTRTPHFMGSVILKQQQTDTSNTVGDVRTLIDGQQRLTTLTILLKVLCLKTEDLLSFDRQFKIAKNAISIQHNRSDIEAYNSIMNLDALENVEAKENDNISKAYKYFKDNLEPSKIDFDAVCDGLIFVGIDLSADEDEQQIFDTINSLGVRLTTAELLKNYFFGRNDIELYEKYWFGIFEKDEETKEYWDTEFNVGNKQRTFIDQLFFSFLQIKIQEKAFDVTTDDKLAFARLEHLFESYKQFAKIYYNDKRALLDEISEYAKTFRAVINLEILGNQLSGEFGVERIVAIAFALDTTTLLPYILFVEQSVEEHEPKNALYACLESYIMRRICCRLSTKGYNQLFGRTLIAHQVLSKNDFMNFLKDQEESENQMPDDKYLRWGFDNAKLTNKHARGILYMIESKIRDRSRHSTQLLGIDKYSLEHIMPKKWKNHWGQLDAIAAKERDNKLLTLGNLAIITQWLNVSIRDADWVIKKEGKDDRGGLRTYSEGMETLSGYLEYDIWDETTISNRANWLFGKACEVWNIDEYKAGLTAKKNMEI
jgi:hypothetical protein